MNPTSEILERIHKSSKAHNNGVFTRLYRYLLREDIYFMAYQKLYANKGSTTRGVDNDTADGFGVDYVNELIADIRNGTYCPKPVRRQYIKKSNGKLRPLGIPSFRDKLLQEAIRMILTSIYEPIFYDHSHGFRPNRSCHTALEQLKREFRGIKWFIEGDIKGCFDNINHQMLIKTLETKIKDSKFINIIRMFLKAGYVEDFTYHGTLSGTPQGGIISPILANIYLHGLDKKVLELKEEFDRPSTRDNTIEYARLNYRKVRLKRKITETAEPERSTLLAEYKALGKKLIVTPSKCEDDKKLVYVRYADDFLIGVCGNRADCEKLKAVLKSYLMSEYSLELSDEKTKITHSAEKARFLGYDVAIRRSQKVKKRKDGVRQRTLNYTVELTVPLKDKVTNYLFKNEIVMQREDGTLWPISVPRLRHLTELDIVRRYDAQFRGICNYYRMAANYNKLIYFQYLMEYSCQKTLASKHDSSMKKVRRKYSLREGWGIPYSTKEGEKIARISKISDCRNGKLCIDRDPWVYRPVKRHDLTLWKRLSANQCELCGVQSEHCKVYHAGSMKKLETNTEWGKQMMSMRRKTLVVCEKCYDLIHQSGTK